MLTIGLKAVNTLMVDQSNTASTLGSGELPVFATPAMIALMENTAAGSVKPYIDPEESTVGTLLNVKHLSASPIGMEIRCESELIEIDRKKLVFHVTAYDTTGLIGEGTHERFIISKDKFLAKTNAKLSYTL